MCNCCDNDKDTTKEGIVKEEEEIKSQRGNDGTDVLRRLR